MDGEQKRGKLTVFTHIKRDDQLRKTHEDPQAAIHRQLRALTAVEARLQVAVSTLDEATATLKREHILVEEVALGLISRGAQRIRRLTLGLALAVGFLLGIAGGVLAASLPMHSGLHRLEQRVDRIQQELQQL